MISNIEERISLVKNAMVPRPRTSDGTSICRTVPQPATGSTEKPTNPFKLTNASCPIAAITKLGTDIPRITRNMIITSGRRFRYNAVRAPHNTPPMPAKTIARIPSVADTGKCSRIISLTLRFCCVNDIPKSPFAILLM